MFMNCDNFIYIWNINNFVLINHTTHKSNEFGSNNWERKSTMMAAWWMVVDLIMRMKQLRKHLLYVCVNLEKQPPMFWLLTYTNGDICWNLIEILLWYEYLRNQVVEFLVRSYFVSEDQRPFMFGYTTKVRDGGNGSYISYSFIL